MYLTTTVLQTEQHHEVDLSILRALCYQSARLYNASLYNVRQYFFNTSKYLTYNNNWKLTSQSADYQILMSDCAQQIMRLADRDMQSFFKLLCLKKNGKYSDTVRLPHYKDKEGLMVCPIQGRTCRIQKDGTVNIGVTKEFREKYNYSCRYIKFTIPKHLLGVESFKEIRIIPQYGGRQFSVQYIYEQQQLPQQATGYGWMSIDPGIENFATCTVFSNGESHQFILDGRRLKNINHYYNKTVSKLKCEYAKNNNIESGNTKRMLRVMNGRNNRINDYFDKCVKMLVDICLSKGVKHLVIGYNKEQKQKVNIGHQNNQNMCYIPHYKFRQKLMNKCAQHGIEYVSQEESYTSKASCLDLDVIPTYGDNDAHEFSGKRVHRGLYKSKDGYFLNADVNGSVNILRKYFKERKLDWAFQESVRALVNVPALRVSPYSKHRNL